MTELDSTADKDWVSNRRNYIVAWGIPTAAMVIAIWFPPLAKTLVWSASLIWMGSACLFNARRCGRTHCYFTGPFSLMMVIPVVLHGFDITSFGPGGWTWLGMIIGIGGGGIWIFTELVWGKFLLKENAPS